MLKATVVVAPLFLPRLGLAAPAAGNESFDSGFRRIVLSGKNNGVLTYTLYAIAQQLEGDLQKLKSVQKLLLLFCVSLMFLWGSSVTLKWLTRPTTPAEAQELLGGGLGRFFLELIKLPFKIILLLITFIPAAIHDALFKQNERQFLVLLIGTIVLWVGLGVARTSQEVARRRQDDERRRKEAEEADRRRREQEEQRHKEDEEATRKAEDRARRQSLYEQAMNLYKEAWHQAKQSGNDELIGQLENYHKVLTSEHLQSVLINGPWQTVQDIMNSIVIELQQLKASATESPVDGAYRIMGLYKTASIHEIKKRYRKLALTYHPDRNHGNKEAESMFKQVGQAYAKIKQHRNFA